MHKLILWLFRNLKNISQFVSIICSFFVMVISLYWIETIIGVDWNWLNFLKPVVNPMLDFSNSIFSFSFEAFGATFDIKYASTIVILLLLIVTMRFLLSCFESLEDTYMDMHNLQKKRNENSFNNKLKRNIEKEQKQKNKYQVLIHTRILQKHTILQSNIDLNKYNKLMNDFIQEKTNSKYMVLDGGFLYSFDNFNQVDNVLEVLFKILKSNSPLEYSICIQIDENLEQIKKLASLSMFGKIIISADTLLRYNFNKIKKYQTDDLGIFQKHDGTLEVHEFIENM